MLHMNIPQRKFRGLIINMVYKYKHAELVIFCDNIGTLTCLIDEKYSHSEHFKPGYPYLQIQFLLIFNFSPFRHSFSLILRFLNFIKYLLIFKRKDSLISINIYLLRWFNS